MHLKPKLKRVGNKLPTLRLLGQYGTTVKGKLPQDIANTFRNGTYFETVTTEPIVLYRVYGGKANQLGSFWTKTKPTGPVQSIVDSALNPQWGNTATEIVKIKVPAGTKLYQGKAAQQIGLTGGGTQVVFPNKRLIFLNNKIDPNWIVK
ncbi:MAG: hypothetical protein IKN18_02620 [Neisseriaceae bacterium]|nr:hypothetical protein [Neisseriaceae bacterium]